MVMPKASSSTENPQQMVEDLSVSSQDDAINDLWEEYIKTKDMNIRNDIVMHYSGLVKAIAIRMRGTYKNYAQLDDIVNQGIIALIDAVEKFDPTKGFKFQTFATIKVRGSVIDYIRGQDWVPRRLRKMSGDLEVTYNKMHTELGRSPTNQELAKEMNISVEQLDRVMEQTFNFNLLSYEEVVWQKMSAMEGELSTDSATDLPENTFMNNELHQQLVEATKALNQREHQVISLYYYEKLKLKDIADVLGVSESRVSQIHSAAILKMKRNMKNYISV